MKNRLILMTVSLLTFSGCGILSKPIDRGVETFFKAIVPDTCEIQLIEKIAIFRKDSLKIPDQNNILLMRNLQSQKCQESYEYIRIIPISSDSVDLIIAKKTYFQKSTGLTTKKYSIVFQNDSIKEIIGSILKDSPSHNNKN